MISVCVDSLARAGTNILVLWRTLPKLSENSTNAACCSEAPPSYGGYPQTPGPTGAVSVGNLAMTGETQATSSVSTVSLSLGSVTAGDRIFVQAVARDATQTDITYLQVTQTGGSATTIVGTGNPGGSGLTAYASGHNAVVSVCGVFQVTGSGTLTLGAAETGSTGALTMSIYAFFLKGP